MRPLLPPPQGTLLLKYGRHGQPKSHYFRLSSDDTELQWESKVWRSFPLSVRVFK